MAKPPSDAPVVFDVESNSSTIKQRNDGSYKLVMEDVESVHWETEQVDEEEIPDEIDTDDEIPDTKEGYYSAKKYAKNYDAYYGEDAEVSAYETFTLADGSKEKCKFTITDAKYNQKSNKLVYDITPKNKKQSDKITGIESETQTESAVYLIEPTRFSPIITKVIFPGSDKYDKGFYEVEDGSFILAESNLLPLDIPDEAKTIIDAVGMPFNFNVNATNIVWLSEIRRRRDDGPTLNPDPTIKERKDPEPFLALMKDKEEDIFTTHSFRFYRGSYRSMGMSRPGNATSRIHDFEISADQDLNGDQIIGRPPVILEVGRTIFPGNDKFDWGLYEIKETKALMVSEMGLHPGDTLLEDDSTVIRDKRRNLYPSRNVIGMFPIRTIRRGIALLEYGWDGKLQKVGFRNRGGYARPFGKPRRARPICHYEEKMDYDFDANRIIGCNNSEPDTRLINPSETLDLVDPIA